MGNWFSGKSSELHRVRLRVVFFSSRFRLTVSVTVSFGTPIKRPKVNLFSRNKQLTIGNFLCNFRIGTVFIEKSFFSRNSRLIKQFFPENFLRCAVLLDVVTVRFILVLRFFPNDQLKFESQMLFSE